MVRREYPTEFRARLSARADTTRRTSSWARIVFALLLIALVLSVPPIGAQAKSRIGFHEDYAHAAVTLRGLHLDANVTESESILRSDDTLGELRRRRSVSPTLLGAVIGAAAGLGFVLLIEHSDIGPGDGNGYGGGRVRVGFTALGALLGGVTGYVIGNSRSH